MSPDEIPKNANPKACHTYQPKNWHGFLKSERELQRE